MSETMGVTLKTTIQLPHPATIFGITVHGVQPLFLIRDRLHVIDRNLLSKIRAPNRSDADRYWISQLNSPDITINPIFAATEGRTKRTPSRDEFVDEYFAAEKLIKKHLPNASLIPHTTETASKSYALVEDLKERRDRETVFLTSVAPLVAIRSSDSDIRAKEQAIFSLAATYGVSGGSLSLLAVLSCLYESISGTPASPGRGVLNPKVNYTTEMAHNCLSDLLALELVIVGSSLDLGDNAFISGDKKLGRFWQSLGATATPPVNGKGTGKLQITNRLLQRIDEDGLLRLQNALVP